MARLEQLRRALDENPASAVFVPLAEEYRKAGRPEPAIKVLRDGLRHHPGFVGARLALAELLMDKGERDEAEHHLAGVLESVPDNTRALTKLAVLYVDSGRTGDALGAYERLLELSPDDMDARKAYDKLLILEAPASEAQAGESDMLELSGAGPEMDEDAAARALEDLYSVAEEVGDTVIDEPVSDEYADDGALIIDDEDAGFGDALNVGGLDIEPDGFDEDMMDAVAMERVEAGISIGGEEEPESGIGEEYSNGDFEIGEVDLSGSDELDESLDSYADEAVAAAEAAGIEDDEGGIVEISEPDSELLAAAERLGQEVLTEDTIEEHAMTGEFSEDEFSETSATALEEMYEAEPAMYEGADETVLGVKPIQAMPFPEPEPEEEVTAGMAELVEAIEEAEPIEPIEPIEPVESVPAPAGSRRMQAAQFDAESIAAEVESIPAVEEDIREAEPASSGAADPMVAEAIARADELVAAGQYTKAMNVYMALRSDAPEDMLIRQKIDELRQLLSLMGLDNEIYQFRLKSFLNAITRRRDEFFRSS